jgi:hypothetical protein
METLAIILIIYGVLCIMIGITKMPMIWNMKKFEIMAKMFKGDRNLQIFVIVWGIIALVVGIVIRP